MPYKIKTYTKNQAKKIGVIVKPSSSKGKKIDVFKKGVKVASVGAIGYNDYPTYMELEKKGKVSKGTAKLRRKLYKIRHKKDRNIKNSNGYYADKLLW
ncbi:MAG: hypothetical protein P1U29_03320 [Candidatus Pelagibacter bacterium]|jgi:hypothetical protein|nr:hypothetical protein [Candidatus Pelagibacter bacterium]